MKVTVTVPVEVNADNARLIGARADKYIGEQTLRYVKRGMATQFGGYTARLAEGGWVDDHGNLVEEGVYVVEAFVPDTVSPHDAESYARAMALTVLNSMVQDAAMYTVDNRAEFVSKNWHEEV